MILQSGRKIVTINFCGSMATKVKEWSTLARPTGNLVFLSGTVPYIVPYSHLDLGVASPRCLYRRCCSERASSELAASTCLSLSESCLLSPMQSSEYIELKLARYRDLVEYSIPRVGQTL